MMLSQEERKTLKLYSGNILGISTQRVYQTQGIPVRIQSWLSSSAQLLDFYFPIVTALQRRGNAQIHILLQLFNSTGNESGMIEDCDYQYPSARNSHRSSAITFSNGNPVQSWCSNRLRKKSTQPKPVSSAIILALCELEQQTVGLNQNTSDEPVSVVVNSTRVSAFLLRHLYPGKELEVGFILGNMRWSNGSGIMVSTVLFTLTQQNSTETGKSILCSCSCQEFLESDHCEHKNCFYDCAELNLKLNAF